MPIFDQGYQHWTGQLSSPAWRWPAITRHGVRNGLANRWLRLLLLCAWTPALGLATVLCIWGLIERNSDLITSIGPLLGFLDPAILAGPKPYRVQMWTLSYSYFLATELRFAMLVILLVGPNLISQDLRYNALPLYFSRPLRRIDYFLGKLGVIAVFLSLVIIVPSLIAYILGLLFSLDLSIFRDTCRIFLASVAYGLVIALSAGLLILALSSLSRNSRYIALFWLGIWFVSSMVSGVLGTIDHEQRWHDARNAGAGRANQVQFNDEELERSKTDWRPLVSYTTNLSRIGQGFLRSEAAWEKVSRLQPAQMRSGFLLKYGAWQFPWHWSALVLAGLALVSICILNLSVKSLDRLK
jgi:ABC-2 type transport system permease protein